MPYKNGPWINGEDWSSGTKLSLDGGAKRRIYSSSEGGVFPSSLEGTLLKVEYAVAAKMIEKKSELTEENKLSNVETEPFEVKGTLNITTDGDWIGVIAVDRSADGGETWITIRQYRRTDIETQGQWDFTISETEGNILYRVRAGDDARVISSSSDSGGSGSGSGGYSGQRPDEGAVYLTEWLGLHPDAGYYGRNESATVSYYYSPGANETLRVGASYNGNQYGYTIEGLPGSRDGNLVVTEVEAEDNGE